MSLWAARWVLTGSLAITVGFGLVLLFDITAALLPKVWRFRSLARRYSARVSTESAQSSQEFSEDELHGTAGIHWPVASLVSGCLGLILSWLLFAESGSMLALAGAALGLGPLAIRRYLRERAVRRVRREVRDFLLDLRLALRLEGALGPALARVSQKGRGVLGERLRHHVQTRLTTSTPQDVLLALAADLRSKVLRDLLRRLEAARRGGESFDRALAAVAEDVVAEMTAAAEQAVEAAPARLLVPMLATLFTPVLVLVLYPLMDRVLRSLAGAPMIE